MQSWTTEMWQAALIGLVVGFVIGYFLLRLTKESAKKQVKTEAELRAAKEQLENQKQQLEKHFSESADLLKSLAQDYQKLYQHLAQSSNQLLTDENKSIGNYRCVFGRHFGVQSPDRGLPQQLLDRFQWRICAEQRRVQPSRRPGLSWWPDGRIVFSICVREILQYHLFHLCRGKLRLVRLETRYSRLGTKPRSKCNHGIGRGI